MQFSWCFALVALAALAAVPPLKGDPADDAGGKYFNNNNHNNNNNNNGDEDGPISNGDPRYSMLCMEVKRQQIVDIEETLGMWYGNEIIQHSQDVPGVFHYDSCVVVHLSDITDQMQASQRDYNYHYQSDRRTSASSLQPHREQQQQQQHQRYLRLVWSENDDHLEYTFNYTDSNPGLWTNVGDQRGSLAAFHQYVQFSGSVQVVKAVNDHMVLTFCGSNIKSSIYTLVLTREPHGLSSEELRGIRGLVGRLGLSTDTIRKVCSTAGAGQVVGRASALGLVLGLFVALGRLR